MLHSIPASYVAISAISFAVGIIVGWLSSIYIGPIGQTAFRQIITLVLVLVYVISVIAEMRIDGYATPILLHAIVGGMIGWLFSRGDDDIGFNIRIGK